MKKTFLILYLSFFYSLLDEVVDINIDETRRIYLSEINLQILFPII